MPSYGMLGKKQSQKWRDAIKKANLGRKRPGFITETSFKKGEHVSVKTEFGKGHVPWNKGIRFKQVSGENNFNWKGGISSLAKKLRSSIEYKEWRTKCFVRDEWTCQTCGIKGSLEVHHLKPFSTILIENKIESFEEAVKISELWDMNNGVTLCKDCHSLADKFRNSKKGFSKGVVL